MSRSSNVLLSIMSLWAVKKNVKSVLIVTLSQLSNLSYPLVNNILCTIKKGMLNKRVFLN